MKSKLSIIFVLLFVFGFNVYASSDEYIIDDYDLVIEVKENNVLNIKETIDTYFKIPKHGIFRKIPTKNTVKRNDGTTSINYPKISNISVNEEYEVYTESKDKVIKIGSPGITLEGPKSYIINYTYDLGDDNNESYDELYFNLIGNEWDTTIENVTFKITMPKEFDKSKLGFSAGEYGTIGNINVKYEVNDNVITGSYLKMLSEREGLTVRLELPEGYFINERSNIINEYLFYIPVILGVILTIIVIVLWNKYGKDNEVVETVEFYPPGDLNSLQLAFEYKGRIIKKDIVSLLIYLANKGYIEIREKEDSEKSIISFITNNKFEIIKLKEYDGNNEYEKMFFEGLFKKKSIVKSSDLTNTFYITINKIMKKIGKRKNKEKIYEKNSLKNTRGAILFAVILYIVMNIIPGVVIGDFSYTIELFMACIPSIIGVILLMSGINSYSKVGMKILLVIISFIFIVNGIMISIFQLESVLPAYIPMYFISMTALAIILLFVTIMVKRNKYGTEVLGKIKGFKRFLEYAKKDELEVLVNQNPKYFYDILPYTYVLGLSDKWIKKFENIAMEEPSWCNNTSMVLFMNSTLKSINNSMVSAPSSSSGGGFSGGGSGGGGGGSW